MNKNLLLKVADAIEQNPEHFDMRIWFGSRCGTTACIGGWAWHIHHRYKSIHKSLDEWLHSPDRPDDIQKILKISDDDHWTALVNVREWLRSDLTFAYLSTKIAEQKAKAAAEYVRWFVATEAGTKEAQA